MKNTRLFITILLTFTFTINVCSQPASKMALTAEEMLGLKSGADPAKALRGKGAGSSREKGRLVVFTIGDSTVKNGKDDGSNGQYGWGSFLWQCFDTTKIQ